MSAVVWTTVITAANRVTKSFLDAPLMFPVEVWAVDDKGNDWKPDAIISANVADTHMITGVIVDIDDDRWFPVTVEIRRVAS